MQITKLEATRLAARYGFRVFPCAANSKKPRAGRSWQDVATADSMDVYDLFDRDGENIAIATGGGVIAIDVDAQHGGLDSAAMLDLPATLSTATPSGGRHLFYRVPPGVRVANSVSALARGIDVRGDGGYVVAHGSQINGVRYKFENDLPIADCPPELLLRITSRRDNAPATGAAPSAVGGTTPAGLAAARRYLDSAAPAVEGDGGDTHTYRVIRRMLDLAPLSEHDALELLAGWNDRCQPPWSDDELLRLYRNAARYGQEPIGRDDPAHGFTTIAIPPDVPDDFEAGVFPPDVSPAGLAAIKARPWVAARRLVRRKVALMVSPGGVGKSTLTLQWACAIALGVGAFTGLDVRERTPVLVVNGEDEREEMDMRIGAIAAHHRLDAASVNSGVKMMSGANNPITLAMRAVGKNGVVDTGVTDKIVRYVRKHSIGVVIVDPLAEFHDAEENSNAEMRAVMKLFRRIAEQGNCAVLVVHHARKGASAAGDSDMGRGASASRDLARLSYNLVSMTTDDASALSVPECERWRYLRLDEGKMNLAAASHVAQWFERQSYTLPCGEAVGVLAVADLRQQTVHDATLLAETLAPLLQGGALSIAAAAKLLADDAMFGGSASTITRRVMSIFDAAGGVLDTGRLRLQLTKTGRTGGVIRAVGLAVV